MPHSRLIISSSFTEHAIARASNDSSAIATRDADFASQSFLDRRNQPFATSLPHWILFNYNTMDCDFCLACDKQSPNGAYCSQQCRLAELENASRPAPPSPRSPLTPSNAARLSWSSQTSTQDSSSNYVLSPAFDFAAANKPGSTSPRQIGRDYSTHDSYFMRTPTEQSRSQSIASQQRAITPCSSRTSLSSNVSNSGCVSSTSGISQKAKAELDGYFSSFSQAKAAKRRPSLR